MRRAFTTAALLAFGLTVWGSPGRADPPLHLGPADLDGPAAPEGGAIFEHALQLDRFGAEPGPGTRPGALPSLSSERPDVMVYGYLAYWDDDLSQVRWDRITHLVLFTAGVTPQGNLTDTHRWDEWETALALAEAYGVHIHLGVANFNSSELRTLLNTPAHRAQLIGELEEWVELTGVHGVNIDFEGLPVDAREGMVSFTQELTDVIPEACLATPAIDWSGAWDYSELTRYADLFIMGYGYHYRSGNPGPVDPLYGGDPWSRYSLQWSVEDYLAWGADPARVILGLPLYGREWPSDGNIPGIATADGTAMFWATAQEMAATHGRYWDHTTLTPYWINGNRQGWYADVESLRARVQYTVSSGLGGVGFFALNYEDGDEEMWSMMAEETVFIEEPPEDDPPEDDPPEDDPPEDDPPEELIDPSALVADAGAPQLVALGSRVALDGSASRGPEGAQLWYRWEQVEGPAIQLEDGDRAEARFDALERGHLMLALTVGVDDVESAPALVEVVVLQQEASDPVGCAACSASGQARSGSGSILLSLLMLGLWRRRRV